MRLSRRTRLKISYLFSNVIIVAITLVVLFAVLFTFFTNIYKSEVLRSDVRYVSSVQQSYERMVIQMEAVASQLAHGEGVLIYEEAFDPANLYTLKKRLVKHRASMSYADDILVYSRSASIICGASSSYPYHDYFSISFTMDENISSKMKEAYQNADATTVIPLHEEITYNQIVETVADFIYPIPLDSLKKKAVVVFRIKSEEIFSAEIDDTDHASAIFINAGRGEYVPLVSNAFGEDVWQGVFQSWLAEQGPEGFTYRIDEIDYLLSVVTNDKGDMFFSASPALASYDKVFSMEKTIIILFSVLSIISIALLYFLSRQHYLPIRSLDEYLDTIDDMADDSAAPHDSFARAQRLLSDMISTHAAYGERLRRYEEKLNDVLLFKLIQGCYQSLEEFEEMEHQSQITFSSPQYAILLLRFLDAGGQKEKQVNAKHILHIIQLEMELDEVYHCIINGDIVIILGFEQCACLSESCLTSMMNTLTDQCGQEPILSVGRPVKSILDIRLSYYDARFAMEHQSERADSAILTCDDLFAKQDASVTEQFEQLSTQLCDSIRKNDARAFSFQKGRLLHALSRDDQNLSMQKFICIDIVNEICETFLRVRELPHMTMPAERMIAIVEAQTQAALSTATEECLLHFERMIGQQESFSNKLAQDIVSVLKENVGNSDFAISQLSELFGRSASSLSRIFKHTLGVSAMEYMNTLRINQAIAYLADTPLSVREIAERVGYINESSFIRKFKIEQGMTPGEYRQRLQGYASIEPVDD